jgi:hypothetical protein
MSGFFDKDERKKLSGQFWNDGETRKITAEKEWRQAKADPDKENCYIRAYDVDTKEVRTFLDFAFLNALSKLPDGVKYDGAILKVTPQQISEREWNGQKYPNFEYEIEVTGEYAEVPKKVEEINF